MTSEVSVLLYLSFMCFSPFSIYCSRIRFFLIRLASSMFLSHCTSIQCQVCLCDLILTSLLLLVGCLCNIRSAPATLLVQVRYLTVLSHTTLGT